MATKSDPPRYLASCPASASGSVAERVPYVSGAILEQAWAVPEPSPVAPEPLPAGVWPRVDDCLHESDEVQRWERSGDERQEALPAHGASPTASLNR